jgi:preprotein translocase subunit SecE
MAEQVQSESQAERDRPARPTAAGVARGSPFRILKANQGKYVRWGTAVGAGALALSAAYFVSDKIQLLGLPGAYQDLVRTLAPVVALLAMAYLIFWLVGRKPNVVDFMIATEGEMKKVNWSTRREVWGATRVVIVTVLALSVILFVVDMFFIFFFSALGVLKFDLMRELFGPHTR